MSCKNDFFCLVFHYIWKLVSTTGQKKVIATVIENVRIVRYKLRNVRYKCRTAKCKQNSERKSLNCKSQLPLLFHGGNKTKQKHNCEIFASILQVYISQFWLQIRILRHNLAVVRNCSCEDYGGNGCLFTPHQQKLPTWCTKACKMHHQVDFGLMWKLQIVLPHFVWLLR